jgi:uncharacterized protein (DUF2252 family)
VGNLGPIAGPDGRVDIQIRDLDQTVIGIAYLEHRRRYANAST